MKPKRPSHCSSLSFLSGFPACVLTLAAVWLLQCRACAADHAQAKVAEPAHFLRRTTLQSNDPVDFFTTQNSPSPAPDASQRYTATYSEFGPCLPTCGPDSYQTRTLQCIDTLLGMVTSPALCNILFTPEQIAQLSRRCQPTPCSNAYWDVGEWGQCSALCGDDARQKRSVTCRNGNKKGKEIPTSRCPEPAPANSRLCQPRGDCRLPQWHVGPWSTCTRGARTREVRCESGADGSDLPAAACAVALGFDLPRVEPCRVDMEDCPIGWTGAQCDVSIGDCKSGVLDRDGACCESGVVSERGSCCESTDGTIVLDAQGNCCSGRVDIVGTCNGTAVVVTLLGQQCDYVLDAGGLCCPVGRLDEFGICDGTNQWGNIVYSLGIPIAPPNPNQALPPQISLEPTPGIPESPAPSPTAEGRTSKVSRIAQTVETGRLRSLKSHPSIPGGTQLRGDWNEPGPVIKNYPVATWHLHRTLLQLPPPNSSSDPGAVQIAETTLYGKFRTAVTYAGALQLLQSESASNGINDTVVISISKEPQESDGWCQVGELSDVGTVADCPKLDLAPAGPNGKLCSARGRPINGQGLCRCFDGYIGDTCDMCSPGYSRIGGLCVKRFPLQGVVGETRRSDEEAEATKEDAGAGTRETAAESGDDADGIENGKAKGRGVPRGGVVITSEQRWGLIALGTLLAILLLVAMGVALHRGRPKYAASLPSYFNSHRTGTTSRQRSSQMSGFYYRATPTRAGAMGFFSTPGVKTRPRDIRSQPPGTPPGPGYVSTPQESRALLGPRQTASSTPQASTPQESRALLAPNRQQARSSTPQDRAQQKPRPRAPAARQQQRTTPPADAPGPSTGGRVRDSREKENEQDKGKAPVGATARQREAPSSPLLAPMLPSPPVQMGSNAAQRNGWPAASERIQLSSGADQETNSSYTDSSRPAPTPAPAQPAPRGRARRLVAEVQAARRAAEQSDGNATSVMHSSQGDQRPSSQPQTPHYYLTPSPLQPQAPVHNLVAGVRGSPTPPKSTTRRGGYKLVHDTAGCEVPLQGSPRSDPRSSSGKDKRAGKYDAMRSGEQARSARGVNGRAGGGSRHGSSENISGQGGSEERVQNAREIARKAAASRSSAGYPPEDDEVDLPPMLPRNSTRERVTGLTSAFMEYVQQRPPEEGPESGGQSGPDGRMADVERQGRLR